ncbi:uncharacterized protein LOC106142814 [Amyelois transitella]|uniref:uncharacterized protein LOC106142814 n=1 Tax=Amyelois transitella TaxID=680683 RepID=UPI00298FF3D8|nr:uncharacterized protein LOC106142814 [Amyelois transitella]
MLGIIGSVVFLAVLLRSLYKNAYRRPSEKFPPGPPSLPVYGAYWIVLWYGYNDLANAFRKLGEIYKTKVVGLYLGSVPTVVINDPVMAKEMLSSDAFDGRMDVILNRLRSYWKRLGIFFVDSYFWYVQRRFSLRCFRDYGFGRRHQTLESVVENEIKTLLDIRLNGPQNPAEKGVVDGDLVQFPHFVVTPFQNGMMHVLCQTTVARDEYEILWELSRKGMMFQRSSDDVGGALSLTPWLKDLAPNWSGYNNLRKGIQPFLTYFEKIVEREMETYDKTNERHFLDAYITKMNEEMREKGRSTFSVEQLVMICVDYLFPATTVAETTLTMMFERLLIQPELQDKMQEEVDRVVGSGRLPNIDDRKNMPYTEACIREAMRWDTPITLGVPHRATRDTVFNGYDIPQDTMVAPNYVMLHMDKDVWGDPENFRPERFIVDGKLDVSKDRSLPFGAGRRLCAGETFARNTMFCIVSSIMQSFRVERAPGTGPLPAPRIQGIITTIPDFWVKLTLRKKHMTVSNLLIPPLDLFYGNATTVFIMFGAIILVVLLSIIVNYLYKNATKRPSKNFPPGPPSLPVYGAYWMVLANGYNNLSKAFRKLGQTYKTKIVGLYLGSFPVIVVNDPVMIKQMLYHEDFDGRTDIILGRLRAFWKRLGIFFTDSYFWYVQRRFSLRYMRDFGFGRRDETLEAVVESEVKTMLDMRLNGPQYPAEEKIVNGELVYLPYFLTIPFINGMLQVLCRSTLPRSQYEVLWEMSRAGLLFQRSSDDVGRALSLTPWLKDLAPGWSGYSGLRKGNQYFLDFFTNLINQEMSTFDESHQRHFLDVYIKKMREEQRQHDKSTFSVEQLILICTDYMFPAATAVQETLAMLLERLVIQPELQDRLHEEVDRVVGSGRLPNLDDRKNMPYTEACIREIMRFETLVPLGVPHRAISDTIFNGYDIPQGTMVSPNLVMLHMDKQIWGDPESFRPERFIENGKLNLALDKSLPFGAGRRLCAGETYARQTMFQVFAGIVQNFRVERAPGSGPMPSPRIQGIITTIPDFWIKLTARI